MSWNSKVGWTEGLFLRPQHLQQQDRYHENNLNARVSLITPYPWGVSALEIDHDLAQQGKFALRRCAGVMPDGMAFDIPDHAPLPEPLELGEKISNAVVGLSVPAIAKNSREIDFQDADSGSRYWRSSEAVIDASAGSRSEEEIDVAHPRFVYEVLDGTKSGSTQIGLARVVEIQDKTIVFDGRYLPPALTTHSHTGFNGLLDRVIGWIETKLEELSRYAADPTAGGGLQYADYFMLQVLNREVPVLRHMRGSQYVHPERMYEQLLRLAGELATFATEERLARSYDAFLFFTTLVVTPMLLLGGVFFPLSRMPPLVESVAGVLPLTQGVAMARALATGGSPEHPLASLALIATCTVVALIVAVRLTTRRMMRWAG